MSFIRPTATLLSSLFALNALAQTVPADSARSLSEVTVFASRLRQPASQTGRSVTIIPGSKLSQYPVNSLDDLLRVLPAIEVQSRGSFGAQADVTLRGSTFNQVLFLLDGMRLNDPLTGHFAGYLPIAPAEIEQIEIVRGAGSALYGADAVGGIINIVTKTFAATRRPDGSEHAATFMAGEWNLKSLNAGTYTQQQGLRFGAGVLYNATDGQLRNADAPGYRRNDLNARTYSLSAAYQLTPRLSAAARASFDQRDFDAQYFYTTSPADLSRETTGRDWYQGQVRYEHSAGSVSEAQVVLNSSSDLYVFNPSAAFVPSSHQMRYFNAQLTHQQQLSKLIRASVGVQADRRAIVSNDRGTHQTWHAGAFALAVAQPTGGLTLTGGLRLDHDQAYGTELVPQLNASQQLGQFTLRAGVGKAIRAADFTERYTSNSLPGPLSGGRNIGNPSLSAERTFNYEGGADWQPLPGLTAKATYFHRHGRNLIDYVSQSGSQVIEATGLTNVNAGATYRFAQNLFEVTTQGLETELDVNHQLSPALRLDGSVGYTYVNVDNQQGIVSQYLTNVAHHLVSGSLTLTHRRASFSFSGVFKQRDAAAAAAISQELTPRYAVFNTRLEVALLPGRLWVLGQIQNLFDARYADLLGAQMPRRWSMAGVRIALGK